MSAWMNKINLKTLSYHMNCIENEYSTRLNNLYRFHVHCGVNASLFSYTYQCSLIWNNKIPYFRIVSRDRCLSPSIFLFSFHSSLKVLSSITSVISHIPPFTLLSLSSQESVQLHFILFRVFSSHFGPSVSYLSRKQRRSVWAVLQKCCLFTSMDIFIIHVRWE